jgi:hypothetical protein
MPEQYNDDEDYEDEDQDLRLRSGDYVRDQQDGESGEIFRMQGDPYERRVRILDRNGKGWYIEPGRLTRVDPQDPDVQRYFGKQRVRDMDEGKADYNFDAEDLKRLERIRDLPTLKTQALALISKPSAKPMKPEKVEWFKNALDSMNSPIKVIKLMYDLLLSGEGHAVVGSKSSMNPNSYRQRFGEQGVAEAVDEKGALKSAQAAAKFMLRNLDDLAALKDYSMHFWSPAKFYQGATMAMRGAGHDEIVRHITQDRPAQFESDVAEGLKSGEYYIHTVYFKDGTKKRVRVTGDEFDVADYYAKRGQAVDRVDYDFQIHSDMTEQSAMPGTAIPLKSVIQGFTVFYNPKTREISVTRGGHSAEAAIEQARINTPSLKAFRQAVERMIDKIETESINEESQDDRNARIIAGEIEDAMTQGKEEVVKQKIKQLIGVGYTLNKDGKLQRMGMYEDQDLQEEQDACYRKVKARYKVWPSAYASGALVQCRKKGADNWGEGGKKK